ncbi:hypothetical protein [Marinobacter fonticola]|uniref:hypothetical protein n=1 Tax=Marinobacter fonticola TaxID=2603215 RepID=UPI001D0DBFF9|nr:hypothetical protein [Marinobacter fonticola]
MTATTRQIISVLLSLLLVISGPALAVSKVTGGQADSSVADCGAMMMNQAESADASSDDENFDCGVASDMACPSAGGASKCGVSFAFLPAGSAGFVDTGSQPVWIARPTIYQDPFLASATPPPQPNS